MSTTTSAPLAAIARRYQPAGYAAPYFLGGVQREGTKRASQLCRHNHGTEAEALECAGRLVSLRGESSRTFPVTGVLDGQAIPGLTLTPAEVRGSLYGGPRLTDGVFVAGGWSDLICDLCGESAHWCPDLAACLPGEFVGARRDAERGDAGSVWQHAEGLVTFQV